MEAKLILKNSETLRILIDSKSIEEKLKISQSNINRILGYYNSKPFEFIRTPMNSKFEILNRILNFEVRDIGGDMYGAKISRGANWEEFGVFTNHDINDLSQKIFKGDSNLREKKEIAKLILIQASFNKKKGFGLLLTENKFLLKKRIWIEKCITKSKLNIVNVKEAIDLMNLFAKKKDIYYLGPHGTADKGLWYWILFRTLIPYYHVGSPILNALAERFNFALMSVDEMGFSFFSDASYDAMVETVYHFYFFIVLLTGIFDNLAITTKNKYKLTFNGEENPSRISLNKKAGKEFLKALKKSNSILFNHINKFSQFIKIIYDLRELVIHREGLEKIGYGTYKEKFYYVKITKEIKDIIDQLGDKKDNMKPISKWGICEREDSHYLDPYNFSKMALDKTTQFTNDYLKMFEFTNYFDDLRRADKNDNYLITNDKFNQRALVIFNQISHI